MAELLRAAELPSGFEYPHEFLRVVELGLMDLEPWLVLTGGIRGLRERYPGRSLVPFACRQDRDDVACWDLDMSGRVVIVHDFASPGWEFRAEFADFNDWLRQAVEDLIAYA